MMSDDRIKAIEDKIDEILFILTDRADAEESLAVRTKQRVQKLSKYAEWDSKNIVWTEAQGTRGPYQRAEPQATLDFKAMLADLKAHGGKMTRAEHFYWVFNDQATVGRKKTKGN